MWSTPDDPEEVRAVRQAEVALIRQWIEGAKAAAQQGGVVQEA